MIQDLSAHQLARLLLEGPDVAVFLWTDVDVLYEASELVTVPDAVCIRAGIAPDAVVIS
jgi:hypothetical protein